jgi:hypothetical protein
MGLDLDDTPDHSSALLSKPPTRAERFAAICDRLLDDYEVNHADSRVLELACLANRAVKDAAESALLTDGGAS